MDWLTILDLFGVFVFALSGGFDAAKYKLDILGILVLSIATDSLPECKLECVADDYECDFLNADKANPPKIFKEVGCSKCANEGYKGRQGIYEVVVIDDEMRRMIHSGESEIALEQYARTRGPGIREDGRTKILNGETSIDEVLRVTMED